MSSTQARQQAVLPGDDTLEQPRRRPTPPVVRRQPTRAVTVRRRVGRLSRRAMRWLWGRALPSVRLVLATLAIVEIALGGLSVVVPGWCSPDLLVLPLLIGSFLLRIRHQLMLVLLAAVVLGVVLVSGDTGAAVVSSAVVVAATACLALVMSRARTRLGVQGTRGESMLFDLHERLLAHGRIPSLPAGWHVEPALRSADARSFAGDFLIAAKSGNGRYLELGLVDVSGKGIQAGTRALQLSGAFGGLLGSVPHREFLPAANKYLIRQGWDEGFATAVHVVLDLCGGEYQFFSAGHPPIARLTARTGRWHLVRAEGPLLGVIPDAEFRVTRGRLGFGDALLLFTDGMVERPGRDISVGLDRLLGAADSLLTDGFSNGASRLIDAVAPHVDDDRALVVTWRTAPGPEA